jgi:predicted Zn-dependent protease
LGETIYEQMENEFDIDTAKTRLANEFFKDLHISSAYPIQITVVNSEIENAFALPGGHIVVYSKMFDIMKSKDEFVALLCHEYSHIAYKHTTRNLFRSLSTYFVISLLLNDVNGLTAVIIDNANQLKSLSYSRSLEEEADRKGLTLMIKRGISADGMIQLFKHLQNSTKTNSDIPEFLSTHPIIDSRVENVRKIEREKSFYPRAHVDLKVIWDKIQKLD